MEFTKKNNLPLFSFLENTEKEILDNFDDIFILSSPAPDPGRSAPIRFRSRCPGGRGPWRIHRRGCSRPGEAR